MVKSPVNAPDTFELHPLVREFVRRQFTSSERHPYITAIVIVIDGLLMKLRPVFAGDPPFSVLQTWVAKVELSINGRKFDDALSVLNELQTPLLKKGYPEEFLRLAVDLMENIDLTSLDDTTNYDNVYDSLVDVLSYFGRFDEADVYMKEFESNLTGKTARYVTLCNMRCYSLWLRRSFDEAKEWGKRGVSFKEQNHLDTRHDCGHNLALAQRDSGEVDPALSYFLHGEDLSKVVKAGELDTAHDGTFYGNIGRCLFFRGDYKDAIVCLVKSASLLDDAKGEAALANQGWAALWIAEALERDGELEMAEICYRCAALRWSAFSPPRSDEARAHSLRLQRIEGGAPAEQDDWQVERRFRDWVADILTAR